MKLKLLVAISLITAVGIILIIIVTLTNLQANGNKTIPTQALSDGRGNIGATVKVNTISPTLSASTPTVLPVTATSTPVSSNPNLKVITPKVGIGEVINTPGFSFGYLKLIHIAELPDISYSDAMNVVYNKGAAWARGGNFEGKTVTISATFGLATIGELNQQGGWIGPQNIPVENCTAPMKCLPTGEILDRIENRPMWILQYNNLPASAFMPPPYACQTQQIQCKIHDTGVFAVDVKTKSVLSSWTYSSQELNP